MEGLATIGVVLCDGTVIASTTKRTAMEGNASFDRAKRVILQGARDGISAGPVSYRDMKDYKAAARQTGMEAYLLFGGEWRKV